jgi:hydroxyacylglutathione hydrolase
VRAPEQFQAKHIFGALNVPSKLGHFGAHVAAFMPYTTPVVLIATDKTEVNEARRALSLVGRYSVEGYILSQAIPPSVSFKEKGAITADVFMRDYYSKVALLDVRQPGEWLADHLYSAHNIPVRELPERLSEVELLVEQDKPLAIICGSGFRSSVAASFLEQKGWKQVLNVQGGMQGVRELKVEVGDRNEERWLKP